MKEHPTLVNFDWAIKHILRDKANFDILEGLLSELLHEDITIESLLESESNKNTEYDRLNRVDMLVNTSNNEKIIIEVQTASQYDFYQRMLFGTSKIITEYISQGEPYRKIPRVISVNILFFNLGEGTDYLYKGTTEFIGIHDNDKLNISASDKTDYLKQPTAIADFFPTYYVIQLKKFNNIINDKFDQWMYLLKNEEIQDSFDAKGIIAAEERLSVLKLTHAERKAYSRYWEDVMLAASLADAVRIDKEIAEQMIAEALEAGKAEGREEGREEGEKLGIEKGREEGIEKGRQEGREEGREEGRQEGKAEGVILTKLTIAKTLLLQQMDIATIATITQLTEAEIKQITI